MRRILAFFLIPAVLAGCVTAPPPPQKPPKSQAAPPVLFGTPSKQVITSGLQALINGQMDQQALLRFTVKADGSVQDPTAVFTNLSPADTTEVIAAFSSWRFKPAMQGHEPVDRVFIYPLFFGPEADQQRTRFMCRNESLVYEPDSRCEIVTVGKWHIYRMNPVYPPELLSKHLAGSVTLSFDIGSHGQAVKPTVVSSKPPGLFDAAALAAVKQWYLQPLNGENGKGPVQRVTVTVKFTPPNTTQNSPARAAPPR
ncbi:MAG: TonB family protein [Gammaproteobacteria bacterium]|nr:TonB family protein [Gammaproteobacteria bacterium]